MRKVLSLIIVALFATLIVKATDKQKKIAENINVDNQL